MHNDKMPTRNVIKQFASDKYYHVYSRGSNKQTIFHDEPDYLFFLSLFKRYLSDQPTVNPRHGTYHNYNKQIELLAYCLMPNHIHLLFYQIDERSMAELMRSIMTTYSKYYNLKYEHFGPVFQSRYLAAIISKDNYLHHISRYIHLNPTDWRRYPFSSIRYYLDNSPPDWLKPGKILDLFDGNYKVYEDFVSDYVAHKHILDELKWELANKID